MMEKLEKKQEMNSVQYLLQQMKLEGISCFEDTFISVIDAYRRGKAAEQALKTFYRIQDFGYGIVPKVYTYNILLKALCKNNRVDGAQKLLVEMSNKGCSLDEVSYTTIVSSLCKFGAVDLLDEMAYKGVDPNVITYTTILNAFADQGNLGLSFAMLSKMFVRGCSPNIHSFTCLTKGNSLMGRWYEALDVWDGMIKEGTLPNVVAYNTLLHGLCLAGNMNMAVSVCCAMERSDCHPNSTTYSTLIDGFAKSGNVGKASEIWNRMINLGCRPNVVVYTCMVDVLCRNCMFEQAYCLIDNMVIENCPPNTITFNTFIKGLCCSGRIEWAVMLYNQMERFGCSGNTTTYNELLDGLFKCNNLTVALQLETVKLVAKMLVRGITPDVLTFNILMDAYCKDGKVESAKQLLNAMNQLGLRPCFISYTCLIGGLCNWISLEAAICCLQRMITDGVPPKISTWNVVVRHLLCKMGYTSALQYLESILAAD
ncbi:hypothetical protein CQW23_01796 [Capsicum baccatum]|uniref:Pentatricopeptide repeat-containing protein n=1 Tax=Capsicum baccatum TaxID=33114 RepID=A0A2G2XPJ9_CAPBA|nr:hypothetical protein CQW23_01796 [Capsicum baccatum]